ncbi:hypothetical protein HMPREF0539_0819 [Lacticaseibacillus rhamnosus LMS2-1]|uniref:Uncharacterized protein n=1 Tax=Lacticaseibacillus rhamnosus (strain LMS2-1) TaxID=525361 RepID=C2JV85_LACRM|nr:D-aminopeptidase family protein [Lacticaseibacillus rhamnosus ATCC 8530]EEN81047.1 hypothetical protein HMPREF0539_0819 [Lacticaseibacillus rhamnosus LMS2-1]
MLKIYISTDIEGLAGIVDFSQEDEDREIFRDLYNQQIEWVLQGIQQSKKMLK